MIGKLRQLTYAVENLIDYAVGGVRVVLGYASADFVDVVVSSRVKRVDSRMRVPR